MCRISGHISHTHPQSTRDIVQQMNLLQAHGGPDDQGLWECVDTGLVLGHRRLSLLDLSQLGHQPMCLRQQVGGEAADSNRYVISFNGEIYNFKNLRAELETLGWTFESQTDTEVILAAFAAWNTHSFAKLKGMFAFALYDTKKRLLYLVRDAAGIKPLYYHKDDSGISFASELRAFAPLQLEENPCWPVYQLAYGHIPEPVTVLKNVYPLRKGCFLCYQLQDGNMDLQSFSHYSYTEQIEAETTAKTEIHDSLQAAVASHLISDAAIGVFLSGGIDSSIISSLAAAHADVQLKTLSLHFREAAFSEKTYQDLMIQQLGCRAYQHLLTEDEFSKSFPQILEAMDMPSCDGMNTWFISKYAAGQGLKAVLSGIGGDELFGGYPSFDRIHIALKLQRMPNLLLSMSKVSPVEKYKRLMYLRLPGVKGLYLFLRGQFTPDEIAQRLGIDEKQVWDILRDLPQYPGLEILDEKNQAAWLELNMYLQNQLLRDADVMSMAHGIEIRVPFLDDRVLRHALRINAHTKYRGEVPKQILVDAFSKILPQSIWKRKKMGFAFPFTDWLGNNEFVKETMESGNGYARSQFEAFQKGGLHWSRLLSLLLLEQRGIG